MYTARALYTMYTGYITSCAEIDKISSEVFKTRLTKYSEHCYCGVCRLHFLKDN